MDSAEIKSLLRELGADLCGIASVDRFDDAPAGFHPRDVLPECKSVISFACRFPAGALKCRTPVVYTQIRNTITARMDAIALELCIRLDRAHITAVPIPTNDSIWDNRTNRFRSIVSQKHAAQAAGLGVIGRHSLLITRELGSMVWLGCVLTELELEPDPLAEPICDGCGKCVDICPVHALDDPEMAQQKCWDHAFGDDPEHGNWCISCHACRDVCPYNLGTDNTERGTVDET